MDIWLLLAGLVLLTIVRRSVPRFVVRVAVVLGGIVAVIGAAHLVCSVSVPFLERRLDERWEEAFAPLSSFSNRFPAQEANPTALRLELVCAKMGIDLATKSMPGRVRPTESDLSRFHELKDEFKTFTDLLVSAEGVLPTPPSRISEYIDTHRQLLEQAIEILLENENPCWERNVDRGWEAPIPNLLGQLYLQRLLFVEMSVAINQLNYDSVERLLEASWVLNQGLFDRTEHISFAIGLVVLDRQMKFIRRLPEARPCWETRLDELDLEQSFFACMQGEAWGGLRYTEMGALWNLDLPQSRYFFHPLSRPFLKLSMIGFAETLRREVRDFPQSDIENVANGDFHAEFIESIPRWNFVARIALANNGIFWVRATRARLGVELTEKIIEVRRKFTSGHGLSGRRNRRVEPSCIQGFNWICTEDSEKTVIEIDHEPPYPCANQIYSRLPLHACFRSSPDQYPRFSTCPQNRERISHRDSPKL